MSYSSKVNNWRREFMDKFGKMAVKYTPYTEHGNLIAYDQAREVAKLIMRHAATHQRLQEEECNGVDFMAPYSSAYMLNLYNNDRPAHTALMAKISQRYDRWEKRLQHRQELIERRILQLAAQFGFSAVFEGDPRGATVKIIFPDGSYDDSAHEGWCVPTNNR